MESNTNDQGIKTSNMSVDDLLKVGLEAEKIHDDADLEVPLSTQVLNFLNDFRSFAWVLLFYVMNIFIWQAFEPEWDFMQCIYFITTSLTTVGYGDFSPSHDTGRLYCIFFLLLGLTSVSSVLTGVVDRFLYDMEVYFIGNVEKKVARTSLDDEEHSKTNEFYRYRKIIFSIIIVIICVTVGTIFMAVTHNWTFLRALYWSIVTSLTVGYGDLSFRHDPGTLAFITIYILISTLSVAVALGNFVEVSVEIQDEKERKRLMDNLDIMDILRDEKYGCGAATTTDGKGTSSKGLQTISKLDFMLFMMEKIHGLDKEADIDLLSKFDELDANGNGALDGHDILTFAEAMNVKKEKRKKKEVEIQNESFYKKVKSLWQSEVKISPTAETTEKAKESDMA